MLKILLIIVIVIGILGNILNIIVFSKRNMRKKSTFRFLLYLSIADLLVLVLNVLNNFDIRLYSSFSCRFHIFLTYFMTQLSSVILMSVSIFRALIITNKTKPLLINKCCTKNQESKLSSSQKIITNYSRYRQEALNSISRNYDRFKSTLHQVDIIILCIIFVLVIFNSHLFLNTGLVYMRANKKPLINILNHGVDKYDLKYINFSYNNISQQVKRRDHLSLTKLFSLRLSKDGSVTSQNQENIGIISFYNIDNLDEYQKTKYKDLIQCFQLSAFYNQFIDQIWVWMDITVYTFIPFLIMSVCSVIIFNQIRLTSKRYFKVLVNTGRLNKKNIQRRLNRNRQLLSMLLITNIYFIASLMPTFIFTIIYGSKLIVEEVLYLFVIICFYSNNSINFILYGFSSQKYREELKGIFIDMKKIVICKK